MKYKSYLKKIPFKRCSEIELQCLRNFALSNLAAAHDDKLSFVHPKIFCQKLEKIGLLVGYFWVFFVSKDGSIDVP